MSRNNTNKVTKKEEFFLELLDTHKNSKRILDEGQLRRLLAFLAKEYDIEKYAVPSLLQIKSSAEYGEESEFKIDKKTIIIYKNGMKRLKDKYVKDSKKYSFARMLTLILLVETDISVLDHECHHAQQVKYLFENCSRGIEYELFRTSYMDSMIESRNYAAILDRYYGGSVQTRFGSKYGELVRQVGDHLIKIGKFCNNDYSLVDPAEINADYLTYKGMITFNKKYYRELSKFWADMLFAHLKRIYKIKNGQIKCPAETYFIKRNAIVTLDKLYLSDFNSSIKRMPLDKRLSLGLPISKYEYNGLYDFTHQHLGSERRK